MAVVLKVSVPVRDVQKSIRFMADMLCSDVVSLVREKVDLGGEDHGLFHPPRGGEFGFWLREDRTLGSYDLDNNTEVIYKKKHQMVRVKLLDDSVKTFFVDTSLSCEAVVVQVGEHLGLKHAEEFALQLEHDTNEDWLDDSKDLAEQGWEEESVLLFRKKYFFSDQYVDKDDPMALHLLFLQNKRNVLNGEMPVQRSEAIQLTSVLLQIELSDFRKETKVDWSKFLPKGLSKEKAIHKECSKAWRGLVGTTDLNGKYRFVQICRSLNTYGVTTFLCTLEQENKEQKGKKNKAEPVLFGVARDRVRFMDPETKETKLREEGTQGKTPQPMEWKLSKIKRWQAQPQTNSIMFDFGDHEANYLVLKTKDCKKISDVLGGYIDIIVKSRREAAQSVAQQEVVSRAQISDIAKVRGAASLSYTTAGHSGASFTRSSSLISPQVARVEGEVPHLPISDVNTALGAMVCLYDDFDNVGYKVPATLSQDDISAELDKSLRAVTDGVKELAGMKQYSRDTIKFPIMTIAQSGEKLVLSARNAALSADVTNEELLAASKVVAGSLTDLIDTVKIAGENPEMDMSGAVNVANLNFDSAVEILKATKGGSLGDNTAAALINEAGKAVIGALEAVVQECDASGGLKNERVLLHALSRSLGRAPGSMAFALANEDARGEIQKANYAGLNAVESFSRLAGDQGYDVVQGTTSDVQASVQLLRDTVETSEKALPEYPEFQAMADKMLLALEVLKSDAPRAAVVQATKDVATSSNKIVSTAQQVATYADDKLRDNLLQKCKLSGAAVSDLVDCAREFTADMGDEAKFHKMRIATETMFGTGVQLCDETRRTLAMYRVRTSSKEAAAAAIGLVEASRLARLSVTDQQAGSNLENSTHTASKSIQNLVESVKHSSRDASDHSKQEQTIQMAQIMAAESMGLAATARRVNSKINDLLVQADLKDAQTRVARTMQELLQACRDATSTMEQELEDALEGLATTASEIDALEALAQSGMFNGDQKQSDALLMMNLATTELASNNEALQKVAISRPQQTGATAEHVSNSMAQVVAAARAVVTSTKDRQIKIRVMSATRSLNENAQASVEAAQAVALAGGESGASVAQNTQLLAAGRAVSSSISDVIAASRGLDTSEVDSAVRDILLQSARLDGSFVAPDGLSFETAVTEVMTASRSTSGAVSQFVLLADGDAKNFGRAARVTASTISGLVDASNSVAAVAGDSKSAILQSTKEAVEATASTLKVALVLAATGDASAHGNLSTSTQLVSDSLSRLMSLLGQDTDSRLDEALQAISEATEALDNVSTHVPPPGSSLSECVSAVLSEIRVLGELSTQVCSTSRSSSARLGKTAQSSAASIIKIIQASINAVALVSLSAPPDIVKGCSVVSGLSHQMVAASKDPKKLNVVARGLAAATTKLIQLTKSLSGLPADQALRLEQAAKALVQGTAKLAQAAKASQANSPGAEQQLGQAAVNMKALCDRVLGASSVSIGESPEATDEASRTRVTEATRTVATFVWSLIHKSRNANQRSGDPVLYKEVSTTAQSVADSSLSLIKAIGALQPGAAEYDEGIESVQECLDKLDSASMSVAVGSFLPRPTELSHQQYQEALVNLAKTLSSDVAGIVSSSRMQSSRSLGQAALVAGNHVQEVVENTLDACSTTSDQSLQSSILGVAKGVSESLLELLDSARTSCSTGGREDQKLVVVRAKESTVAIGRLVQELKSGVVLLRDIDDAAAAIHHSFATQEENTGGTTGSYEAAKNDLSDVSRHMAGQVSRLMGVNKENALDVGTAAKAVADSVPGFVSASYAAAQLASSDITGLRDELLLSSQSVVQQIEKVLLATKALALDPRNSKKKHELTSNFREFSDSLGKLLTESKRGAVGEKMFDDALQSIERNITKLSAAALFAAAGQLEVDKRDLKHAKKMTSEAVASDLVDSAKQLVLGSQKLVGSIATSKSLESFADACRAEAKIISSLHSKTLVLSSLLSDLSAQQALLQAAKAVTQATQGLVLTGKDAVRDPQDKSVQHAMSSSSETVAHGIQALIDLAKRYAMNDGGVFGALFGAQQTIQSALDATSQSAREGNDKLPPEHADKLSAKAEDVLQACRDVSAAVVAVSSASLNSATDEMPESVSQLAKSSSLVLMRAVGATISSSPSTTVREAVVESARTCALGAIELLVACKEHATTGLGSGAVQGAADAMAENIQKVVESSRGLPGGAGLQLQVEAGGDLESEAGRELEAAAEVIAAAMRKLQVTVDRKPKIPSVSIDTAGVTEQILEASMGVASSTHFLVQQAGVVQSERLENQHANPNVYHKDPMWANGLISAAKQVAGSTQQLVNSAQSTVAGEAEDEELPAVAKTVAESTAHLVSASRSKATAGSESVSELGKAARKVAEATAKLVSAAREAEALREEEDMEDEAAGMLAGSTIAKIEQHMRVLKAEKELERARREMGGLNRANYKN